MNMEKCIQCSKSLKDKKKGTKYCSDTCKQKAYTERKESTKQPEIELPVFYLEDYESIQGTHWGYYFDGKEEGSDLDIPTFCFLMQNANPEWTIEQKETYILGFCATKNHRFDPVRDSQAFRRFKEDFLAGKYKLVSRKVEVKTI